MLWPTLSVSRLVVEELREEMISRFDEVKAELNYLNSLHYRKTTITGGRTFPLPNNNACPPRVPVSSRYREKLPRLEEFHISSRGVQDYSALLRV